MRGKNLRIFFWLTLVLVALALSPIAIAMVPGPIEEDDIPPSAEPEPGALAPQIELLMPPRAVRLSSIANFPPEFYSRCASIGLPSRGALWGGTPFPSGTQYYYANRPDNQWGTPETIDGLLYAARRVWERFGASHALTLGDLSQRSGGHVSSHASHQSGRDADVGFYYRTGAGAFFQEGRWDELDMRRSWAYIESLVELNNVQYIFMDYGLQALFYNFVKTQLRYPAAYLDRVFQYPNGAGHNSGILRHARGHRAHLHVRFYSPIAVANARNRRFDNPQFAELQSLAIEREAAVAAAGSVAPGSVAVGNGAYYGASGKRQVYVVRDGDSLWSIAREHGATVNQIRAWNNMSTKDRLRVGQRLTIYLPKADANPDAKPST